MAKFNVQCPKCGANIKINAPEVVAVVAPISAIPVVAAFPAKKLNAAEAKIEALRSADVNVENLFSIRSTNGAYEVGRFSEGQFSVVSDNDPIFAAIKEIGRAHV